MNSKFLASVIYVSVMLVLISCAKKSMPFYDDFRSSSKFHFVNEKKRSIPHYYADIRLSSDSLNINRAYYHALCIWNEKCQTNRGKISQGENFIRFDGDRVYFLPSLEVQEKDSTLRVEQLLFSFNSKPKDTWRVVHIGFGNVIDLTFNGRFLNPIDLEDSLYRFSVKVKSWLPSEIAALPAPKTIYLSKRMGVISIIYVKSDELIYSFGKRGKLKKLIYELEGQDPS